MQKEPLNQFYSVKRLYYLVRNRLFDDMVPILVGSAAVLALNLLLVIGSSQYNIGSVESWAALGAIAGVLLAGNAFSRMHDGKAGTEWILLPASSAEKYSAALVMYLLVYPVLISIIAVIETLIISSFGKILYGMPLWIYNPLSWVLVKNYGNYAFFILLALAGSARFRKFAIVKTAALVLGFVLLSSLLLLLGIMVATPEGRIIMMHGLQGSSIQIQRSLEVGKEMTLKVLYTIFTIGTAAFVLGYGYALVCEKEARDEVQ
ncbi:hypothetical protein [Gracilinema caldarium]|uniref:hypothetical protein n=1 Tax=Gracilinema caldarium TaxID=215591 RepID=UPI0026EDAC60|nr:hypothetical protein [Gracilinema caldarium]